MAEMFDCIPSINLGAYGSFMDHSSFLNPVVLCLPSDTVPLRVSPDIVNRHKDDIWYINIASDHIFEYRSVELPFEVSNECPSRNLTECEWRSVGVTQSRGWENHWRNPSESNILLFRRVVPGVSELALKQRHIQETLNGIRYCDYNRSSDALFALNYKPVVQFPTFITDWSGLFGRRREIEFSSCNEILEFQLTALRFALKQLNSSIPSFP